MGSYLEKNVQALAEMQGRFAEPGKGLYDTSALSPDGWTKFISGQAPMMQNLMSVPRPVKETIRARCRNR